MYFKELPEVFENFSLVILSKACLLYTSNHGSAGGSVQPAHHVKQGGLAATRGSHNSHKLAVLHGEIYAVKGAGNVLSLIHICSIGCAGNGALTGAALDLCD